MAVIYNNNLIIPAPLVTLSKNYIDRGDGSPLSTNFEILLRGSLLPDKGSPDSTGTFAQTGVPADESITGSADRFDAIRYKQQAIHDLFSNQGQALEWYLDGQQTVKCYPHVESINFAEGVWVQRCDYEIRLTANRLFGPGSEPASGEDWNDIEFSAYNLRSASENWNLQEAGDGTDSYRLTHTVQGVAGDNFGEDEGFDAGYDPAWKAARQFCLDRIGDQTTVENILNGSSLFPTGFDSNYTAVEQVRSETFDELAGSYSITDNWIIATGTADFVTHNYTVRQQSNNAGITDGLGALNNYTLAGTIQGYNTFGSTDKYTNAKNFLDNSVLGSNNAESLIEAAVGGGLGIYDNPRSVLITRDQNRGLITYELTFSDALQTLPTGITTVVHSYDIVVSDAGGDAADTLGLNQIAAIPIPGRAAGPVIQVIGTRPLVTRTVTLTLNLDPATNMGNLSTIRADVLEILGSEGANVDPGGNSWKTGFRDNYNFQAGVYSATIEYTIEGT